MMRTMTLLETGRSLFLFALLPLACGGGGGPGEGGPLVETVVRRPSDIVYLHGEEIEGDTLRFGWTPEEGGTISGRALRPPSRPPEEDETDLRARYGRVPMVKRLTGEGAGRADAVARFRRTERDLRGRLADAYGSAREGMSEEERTRAALEVLTAEDRALLEEDPAPGAGIVEIRFAGRPREIWILRSPGKGGLGLRGEMSRRAVADLAGELRSAFAASTEGTLSLLGKREHILTDPDDIRRGAAQIEAARGGRHQDGPLPPEALLPFRRGR